ncbi:helix-turn-helix domain-containing protein [Calditerricola satsumensis]|uniref:Helix-turn-helix domain-containing protein n=1 Tax=Calditerricola satsumensis TaxID=373054 RepID=A0A8J3BC56_9BACI|nr:hypothetical protein [Calditerricola satsumensis]GGK08576.1 hypothetical protein GCM10007043_23310 [Calditerricola satsumensis]
MFAANAAKTIDIAAARARRQRLIAEARNLSRFGSLAAFEAAINAFVAAYGGYLKPSEQAYLRYLVQKARLVPGVIWARVETIAKETGLGVRTIYAVQRRLEQLGIIQRVQRRRTDGHQGSSFTVVLPFRSLPRSLDCSLDEAENPRKDKHFGPFLGGEYIRSKDEVNKKEIKNVQMTRDVQGQNDRDRGTRDVPLRFAVAAKQGRLPVKKLWNRVRLAARRMGLDPTTNDVIQVAVKTLRANLRSLRAGKVYGDFAGYFYRSMIHQLAIYRRRTNASIYDWLGTSKAVAEAVAAVQEVAAAVAHQERMEALDGYEERQERRIADDPELLALLMELEVRKNAM